MTASTGCRAVRRTPWPSAARTGTPIYAEEAVLDQAGYLAEEDDEGDGEPAEEVVEQFKEFIDTVNPEDFAS